MILRFDRAEDGRALDERLLVCNCATCGRLLLSRRCWGMAECARAFLGEHVPYVAGRVRDRPYCRDCLEAGQFSEVRRGE